VEWGLLGPLAWCCFSGVGTKATLYMNIPSVIGYIIWISAIHQLLTLIILLLICLYTWVEKFLPVLTVSYLNSEPQAICYIETSNLDGETNLKIRQAIPETAKLLEIKDLALFKGTVQCELPNRHLYEFSGVLKETDKQYVKVLCNWE